MLKKSCLLCLCLLLLTVCVFDVRGELPMWHIKGVVLDEETNEPVDAAVVQVVQHSGVHAFSDEKGDFELVFRADANSRVLLRVTRMGYTSHEIEVEASSSQALLQIKLRADAFSISKVIVTRKSRHKYSRKNNPAIQLIEQVIARKHQLYIDCLDYYQLVGYEKALFALNNYKVDKGILKGEKYLAEYSMPSPLDSVLILPYTERESFFELYAKNRGEDKRKIVLSSQKQGFDKESHYSRMEQFADETFPHVNIRDNSIQLLLRPIVSPLNEHIATHFYHWDIGDTILIENEQYIKLRFWPASNHDFAFKGSIVVKSDSTYAIKEIDWSISSKANVNFVKDIRIRQSFVRISSGGWWAPKYYKIMANPNVLDIGNFYFQRETYFSRVQVNIPNNQVFASGKTDVYLSQTPYSIDKLRKEFMPYALDEAEKTPNLDKMISQLRENKWINIALKSAQLIQTEYIGERWDSHKNKLYIGALGSLYGYNSVEGSRVQLNVGTSPNLHPQLSLFGYVAYAFRDDRLKYTAEATWAFSKRERVEDEFPLNNITVSHTYDIRTLGTANTYQGQSNILQSLKANSIESVTYDRAFKITYSKEWHNGLLLKSSVLKSKQQLAHGALFQRRMADGTAHNQTSLHTTEVGLILRYAHNEKYVQTLRKRARIPSNSTIITWENKKGVKFLGGKFNYFSSTLTLQKNIWIPPFGKLLTLLQAGRVWGNAVPYPFLLSPSANNGYKKQYGTLSLAHPMEFINDKQLFVDIEYHMEGLILNKIPLLQQLRLREVVGIKTVIGRLNHTNMSEYTPQAFKLPENTYTMNHTPYIEYSVGVENIFSFLHLSYVRRVNYLHHSHAKKSGIRMDIILSF